MSKVDTHQSEQNIQLCNDELSLNQRIMIKNVREAIANNRIDGLSINPHLVERVIAACKDNQKLDTEQLIREFVTQN
ncbi:antitoxin VbhA family protein [Alteromonadaceae bacterium BrNp21-10]|nr:antitoxin VbhA family protein [Alteromonadaceae bacterium BrNp21-10]